MQTAVLWKAFVLHEGHGVTQGLLLLLGQKHEA